MPEPYLRRIQPKSDTFTYDIPERVRSRFMFQITRLCEIAQVPLDGFARAILNKCVDEFGGYHPASVYSTGDHTLDHFQNHLAQCEVNYFLTIIEWIFQFKLACESPDANEAVEKFNYVFRTEGIGFALTPYSFDFVERQYENGRTFQERVIIEFPEIIKKTNEVVHSAVVIPTLQLLGGQRWQEANDEMLKAHKHLREGNFREAINQAGCCLESVLKLICAKKKWTVNPDKDTLNSLLQAVYKGGLFQEPYINAIQASSGKIRNTWGGHGKANTSHGDPSYEMAEHMIHVTSSHVLFLVTQAKI